ncbi:cysteine-rich receptor-like protein kinase 10, partial [Quercus suber]
LSKHPLKNKAFSICFQTEHLICQQPLTHCLAYISIASGEITTDSLQYDLATIEAATDNFADDNKLGSGGFGEVFKAWKHWSNGSYLDVLDSDMRDSCSRNEVIQCIHIGLLCVQENPADRPSMATIILMLNSGSVTLPSPQKPPFFLIVEQSRTCQQ